MNNFICDLQVQKTSLKYLVDIVIDIYDDTFQCYTNECIKEIFTELIGSLFIVYKNISDEDAYEYLDERIIEGYYYNKYLEIFDEVLEYVNLDKTVVAVVNVHNGKEIEMTFNYLINNIEKIKTKEELSKFINKFLECIFNLIGMEVSKDNIIP